MSIYNALKMREKPSCLKLLPLNSEKSMWELSITNEGVNAGKKFIFNEKPDVQIEYYSNTPGIDKYNEPQKFIITSYKPPKELSINSDVIKILQMINVNIYDSAGRISSPEILGERILKVLWVE